MSLLDDARAVLAEGPLCDPCLGRVVADRSHGLANAERGQALRVAVALADDVPFEGHPGDCWVCDDLSAEYEPWAERAATALHGIALETYQVGTRVPPLIEENDRLLRESAGLPEDAGEPFKAEWNREVGKRLGTALGIEVDFERPDVVVLCDLTTDEVEVRINPAFVYGRYRKLVREIPQTEWPCRECGGAGTREGAICDHCGGSGYLYEESVEQLVAPHVREAMDGSDAVFHGAGREDVDARMLGTGRPFVVEVKEPRDRVPDLAALEATINEGAAEKVEVTDLALATHEMVERVKELPANKTYRAAVAFAEPVMESDFDEAIETLRGATIEQETPERVTHRRADRTRVREVFDINGMLEDDSHAAVEVHGEGGLYIKELLHGDGGRTQPSLASLLAIEIEVKSLDVIAVEGETAPFNDPAFLREAPRRD